MKCGIAIFLVALIAGCGTSRGFDRGNLRAQITGTQKTVTEEDIQSVLELKPQLPFPFKLAIYFAQPKQNDTSWSQNWIWSPKDKEAFMSAGHSLKEKGIISDILFVNEALVSGNSGQPLSNRKAVRLAAARAGADAVLIIHGISANDRYNNNLGPLYLFIVTAFFVPGTELDSMLMAHAALWDVRNDFLYLSAEAEGISHQKRPAAFIEDLIAVNEAKQQAVQALSNEVASRVERLAGK